MEGLALQLQGFLRMCKPQDDGQAKIRFVQAQLEAFKRFLQARPGSAALPSPLHDTSDIETLTSSDTALSSHITPLIQQTDYNH